ncbi:MAG TPA: thioesterase domain-containing protein [Solirubrobacteraceae bacterium]|jgi:surfactin synthase thioesterase subunit|nr:thioesterase domain-containing protein [Solirubrobacteraceae bacterium]
MDTAAVPRTRPPRPRRRAPRDPWLLRPPAPDAEALLLCLPYVGTGASMYHAWPRTIGRAEVCPIQLPGRESRLRDPVPPTFEALADEIAAGLRPRLDRPYAIFGHCASAYLALEVALRLDPGRLIVSSMMPPRAAGSASILDVPEERLGDVVADTMRARGLEPTTELVELSLDAMRGDVRAYRRYERLDCPRLRCPITVLAWTRDDRVPPQATAGWEEHGDVDRTVLDGDHWSFLTAPPALQDALAKPA